MTVCMGNARIASSTVGSEILRLNIIFTYIQSTLYKLNPFEFSLVSNVSM